MIIYSVYPSNSKFLLFLPPAFTSKKGSCPNQLRSSIRRRRSYYNSSNHLFNLHNSLLSSQPISTVHYSPNKLENLSTCLKLIQLHVVDLLGYRIRMGQRFGLLIMECSLRMGISRMRCSILVGRILSQCRCLFLGDNGVAKFIYLFRCSFLPVNIPIFFPFSCFLFPSSSQQSIHIPPMDSWGHLLFRDCLGRSIRYNKHISNH